MEIKKIFKYIVNGQEYKSLEEMPGNLRVLFEDRDKNGVADVFQDPELRKEIKKHFTTRPDMSGQNQSEPAEKEVTAKATMTEKYIVIPAESWRILLIVVIIIGLIMYWTLF